GDPSVPTADPNQGFWSGAKKPEASKTPTPAPKTAEGPPGGFWAKGGGAEPERKPSDAAFWTKAEDKKKEDAALAALPEEQKVSNTKRRRRRILWITLGSILLVIVVVIALAPTIAGAVAPGIIASKAGARIGGRVAVESTSFGWFGPQRVKVARLLSN